MNNNSPSSIRALLSSRKLATRKRWGQNFLINRGVREKVVRLLDIHPHHHVWEVGPGLGSLTSLVLEKDVSLTAFEIDKAYGLWLEETFASHNLNLVMGDVLKTWQKEWLKTRPDRVFGNLPFNTASALIASLVEENGLPPLSVFIVQEEMGRRIMASPKSKDYSAFSILCQTHFRTENAGVLAPGSFYPSPKVSSRIIILHKSTPPPFGIISDPPLLKILLRSLFISRRKTLLNNLIAAARIPRFPNFNDACDAFNEEGINLHHRPETVGPREWVNLANRLSLKVSFVKE